MKMSETNPHLWYLKLKPLKKIPRAHNSTQMSTILWIVIVVKNNTQRTIKYKEYLKITNEECKIIPSFCHLFLSLLFLTVTALERTSPRKTGFKFHLNKLFLQGSSFVDRWKEDLL